MQVTLTKIKKLKPCQDRLDNFTVHYPAFKGTLKQFLALDKITDADKRWVYFRLLPKKNVAKCAADIAELVLHQYESRYPGDNRPREAIKAARSGDKVRAHTAAAAAYAAYTAAAYAAANAAYAAADAAYAAATDAAYTAAAYAAANAAYAAATYAEKATYIEAEHKIMLKWANKR